MTKVTVTESKSKTTKAPATDVKCKCGVEYCVGVAPGATHEFECKCGKTVTIKG